MADPSTPLRRSSRTPMKKKEGSLSEPIPTPTRSTYIGVRQTKSGWIGEITFQGKKISSELCETAEEAAYERDRLTVEYRGLEHVGRLNFPERFQSETTPKSGGKTKTPQGTPMSAAPASASAGVKMIDDELPVSPLKRPVWWFLVALPVFVTLAITLYIQYKEQDAIAVPPSPPACTLEVESAQLITELEKSPTWAEWAENVSEEIRGRWKEKEGHPKALTVLLASHKSSTRWSEIAFNAITPRCAETGCVLTLEAAAFNKVVAEHTLDWAEGRGELEKQLAQFFKRCPHGVLLFQGIHELGVGLIPALLPAISEGGLYTYDGIAIPTTQATVILTTKTKAAHKLSEGTEEDYAKSVKNSVEKDFVKNFSPTEIIKEDDAKTYARAFRRRLDFVAPLSL